MTVVVTHSTPSDSSFSASGAVAWDASHTLAGVGTMAGQDANTVAIIGGAIDATTVGGTTPAAGTFTTLIGGKDAANYGQLTGGATTKAVQFQTLGTDTNISMALQPKGTGAIDLAAGSRGVNISNGGTVTTITRTAGGTTYATAPTVTISAPTTAGGVQATATCTVTAGVVDTTFTITAAGSGYVEQPTVTFSGGGGSGAAAFAVVGGATSIKTLNSVLSFVVPSGEGFRVTDVGTSGAYWTAFNGTSTPILRAVGASSGYIQTNSAVPLQFGTSGATEQFRVAHTASAVNYVQVTGGATGAPGSGVTISTQGSDSSIGLNLTAKGGANITFFQAGTSSPKMLTLTSVGGAVNFLDITSGLTGTSPILSAQGTDTDIDLALTPKGAGNVRFATYTAGIIAQAGYITIKDSGGTVRRLLVG